MPEADVLYTDVKFKKKRDKANASPSEDTTYSEVQIAKAPQPSTEPTDPQQAGSNRRSGVTWERLAVVVLTLLLVATATALGYMSYKNMQTAETLQRLSSENFKMRQNLTEQRKCETQPCITVKPTCWTVETCQKCEAGWEQYGKTCYYFSTNKFSWSESMGECRLKGGDLVKIDSKAEQMFLDEKLRKKMDEDENKFWIGLTDSKKENSWLWVDGTPLNPSLTFWIKGEPDNWRGDDKIEEDCARMGELKAAEDYKSWLDFICERPQKYVCEKQAEEGQHQCV